MSRRLHLPLAAFLSAGSALTPSTARAEVGGQVAVDLDLGAPMDTTERFLIGGGGRFGWRFDLGPVWLQPEAAGGYTAFVDRTCRQLCTTNDRAARVTGGVRVGGSGLISGVIEPVIFGHAGYGWAWISNHHPQGVVIGHAPKGPAFDVGLALDVKAVRWFRFGAHGAYNVVAGHFDTQGSAPRVINWISVGLHAGAAF